MMPFFKRDRRAIVLGGLAVCAVVLGRLAVIPWLEDWGQARDDIARSQVRLADLERRLGTLAKQRKRLTEVYGPAAAKPLADADKTRIAFLGAVEDTLRDGVRETSLQPQPLRPVPEVPGSQAMAVRVTRKCQLSQVTRCLSQLRAADVLILVDQLQVSANERQPGLLEVTMVLSTLTRSEAGKP